MKEGINTVYVRSVTREWNCARGSGTGDVREAVKS
jgi:hypothetical protein